MTPRGVAVLIASLLFAPLSAGADEACKGKLVLGGATATFRTERGGTGKEPKRSASIAVEVTSTATVPVSAIELGVFLGASMATVRETRVAALPTFRPRELPDGGIAFRARIEAALMPGATQTFQIEKDEIPLDKDLSSVTAVLIDCRPLRGIGDFVIETGPVPDDDGLPIAAWVAAIAAVVTVVYLLARSSRR